MGNITLNQHVDEGNEDSLRVWHVLLIGAAGLYLGKQLVSSAIHFVQISQSKRRAYELIAERNSKHFNFDKVPEKLQEQLLVADCTKIREMLMEGTCTSVDLVNFFGNRCQTIGRQLCLTTEELFESAMEKAKACDQAREEAKKNGTADQLPFLHGIPISIKELYLMKDCVSTVGCSYNNVAAKEDSPALLPLFESGAIPLVRGNVPQGALSIHSENFIWGLALNPYDKSRSCGGSSGGDAGLVAARCVPLAIGSDLASSIRIPAHFNGLNAFKPTQGRLTNLGGQCARVCKFDILDTSFRVTPGPLARSMSDCIETFKIFSKGDAQLRDPFQPSISFNQELFDQVKTSKGKIGLLTETPFQPISAASKRAIDIARKGLMAAGYEVVDFHITPEEYAMGRSFCLQMISAGTAGLLMKDFERVGEKILPGIWLQGFLLNRSSFFLKCLTGLFRMVGLGRSAEIIKDIRRMNIFEYEVMIRKRYEFCVAFSKKWQASGIQALVTPTYPHCAMKSKLADDMGLMLEYTFLWSILHYPGGVLTVTDVQDGEDDYTDNINDGWTKIQKDNAEGSKGMPISVTVYAHNYEDEKALAVLDDLDKQINFRMAPPKLE